MITLRFYNQNCLGSVAVAGAALDWLKNNLGILENTTEDSEALAKAVHSTGDVYFVPAFEGLYAPYWRTDARGCVSFFCFCCIMLYAPIYL